MHKGTKETTPFHIFKDEVCKASGLRADQINSARLHVAYDMGEAVWMVAEEMKLRADFPAIRPHNPMALCIKRVKVN